MSPLLIGLGVVAALLVIYVCVRLSRRSSRRHYSAPSSYDPGRRYARGGSSGGSGSSGSTYDPLAYDDSFHYSFHAPSAAPDSHSHHSDHASHHYTPEASSYGGDIGSVDSSSYGDSGGCDSGGGGGGSD